MKNREPGYMPPPAVQQTPRVLVLQNAQATGVPRPQVENKSAEPVMQPPPQIPQQHPVIPKKKAARTLPGVVKDVIVALGKTIALLAVLSGAYLIYQKLMQKKPQAATVKVNKSEPSNMEEAVSSYIKHKLKK